MKRVWLLIASVCVLFLVVAWALAGERTVHIFVDGRELAVFPPPFVAEGRVFAPLRAVMEASGSDIDWDAAERAVLIQTPAGKGERYLQGLQCPAAEGPDISRNLVSAAELQNILDEDRDGDLADYRLGHSGGDLVGNDPLVVDVRARCDYEAAHIPGAVWIAPAQEMGGKEHVARLRELLSAHAARGGENEVVLYCYTGHTAALAAGVLGTQGFNVKNLLYGFDFGWAGTRIPPAPLMAPVEEKSLPLADGG